MTRIVSSLPTIRALGERGASVNRLLTPYFKLNVKFKTWNMSRLMTKPTVWPEPSLCVQWIAKDTFLHANSEDSDQTGWMPRLIWVFAGRTATLLVLSWGGSYILLVTPNFWTKLLPKIQRSMSHLMRKPLYAICEQQRRCYEMDYCSVSARLKCQF